MLKCKFRLFCTNTDCSSRKCFLRKFALHKILCVYLGTCQCEEVFGVQCTCICKWKESQLLYMNFFITPREIREINKLGGGVKISCGGLQKSRKNKRPPPVYFEPENKWVFLYNGMYKIKTTEKSSYEALISRFKSKLFPPRQISVLASLIRLSFQI